jgi:hypothetical protein
VDIYVQLAGATDSQGNYVCDDTQTYSLSSTGELTFKGNLVFSNGGSVESAGVPAFIGANTYGLDLERDPDLGGEDYGDVPSYFNTFERESSGALELAPNASVTGPVPEPGGGWTYAPYAFTPDPTDHVAVMVQSGIGGPGCYCQMASYTETNGKLVSTNTWENMPYWPDTWNGSQPVMSPSGKLLVLSVFPGIQLFHFNAANPITPYTGIIGTEGYIGLMAWDNDNHLYAVNAPNKHIHIYNATPTSVKEVAGSPVLIPDKATPIGLIVRSN